MKPKPYENKRTRYMCRVYVCEWVGGQVKQKWERGEDAKCVVQSRMVIRTMGLNDEKLKAESWRGYDGIW